MTQEFDIQTNEKTGGQREVGKKLQWQLIPPEFDLQLVAVLDYGAGKYAPYNFEAGMDEGDLIRGAMAHLVALRAGETRDRETGILHTAHAAWNLLALGMMWMRISGLEGQYQDRLAGRRRGNLVNLITCAAHAAEFKPWGNQLAAVQSLRVEFNWPERKKPDAQG